MTQNLAAPVLLRCLVVTAIITVVVTTIWATTVTFGPLLGTVVTSRGSVYWITAIQV